MDAIGTFGNSVLLVVFGVLACTCTWRVARTLAGIAYHVACGARRIVRVAQSVTRLGWSVGVFVASALAACAFAWLTLNQAVYVARLANAVPDGMAAAGAPWCIDAARVPDWLVSVDAATGHATGALSTLHHNGTAWHFSAPLAAFLDADTLLPYGERLVHALVPHPCPVEPVTD
jgi:hypothetical protein